MKISKKIVLGLTLTFILSATVAYATSSSDYLTKAQKYINDNCAKGKISNQTSLNCYLFYKLSEIGTQVDSNTSRIVALENAPTPTPAPSPTPSAHKELRTYDANDVELGLYTDRTSFFYETLGVIVPLNDNNFAIRQDAWYQSTNCTGQPYALMGTGDHWDRASELLSVGPGSYYTINKVPGATVAVNSLHHYNGSSIVCQVATANEQGWPITSVSQNHLRCLFSSNTNSRN